LGVGGTFMGGLALLARELKFTVSGCDAAVYPPMSTQLAAQQITFVEGYDPKQLDELKPDVVVIGNAFSRGNPLVEAVLDRGMPYTSGAQWVAENVLPKRWVLAVAGTHGKTTTASLTAWILEHAGLKPGFLIGGIPENFGVSARLGADPFFVIEADEYDTAFFDKRSKFVHYRARTAIINNLEYDHADIFPDLAAIQKQCHHFVRLIPKSGRLIVNGEDKNVSDTLALGCWSEVEAFASVSGWGAELLKPDGSAFRVLWNGKAQGEANWDLLGVHNVHNALAAVGAARHAGVPVAQAVEALATFKNVKRRLETRGVAQGITVYDDFAHHPTAIALTLKALRARVGTARVIAVLEPRSNTMKMGVHRDSLGPSLVQADRVLLLKPPELNWNFERVTQVLDGRGQTYNSVDDILRALEHEAKAGDHVLIMSNGGFGNLPARLLERLAARAA
jgi:UDP-N-acetylmuramate: L-alanyl-gamma-D-glutamyl-meso-diaminopimelate ligase